MDYILPFIIGYIFAFIGLIAPSMLNMTAAKTSLEKGKRAGVLFAVGAASIVVIQASIGAYLASIFTTDQFAEYKKILGIAAFFVLLGLAAFFFMQARKEFQAEGKEKKGSTLLIGMGMSSLNMLAVPFYFGIAETYQNSESYRISLEIPFRHFYVIGAVLGAFTLFAIYAMYASIITKKASFIAKNINYVLAGLFVVLAIVSAINAFS